MQLVIGDRPVHCLFVVVLSKMIMFTGNGAKGRMVVATLLGALETSSVMIKLNVLRKFLRVVEREVT